MQKVFITGVAGFIGYHVAEQLLNEGVEVFGMDNFDPYYRVDLKMARIQNLKNKGLVFFEEDICHESFLIQVLQDHKITHLLHLAAQAGVRYAETHPHTYVKNNFQGFASILEAARKSDVSRLVYASSSSVYTNSSLEPEKEESEVNKPNNFYAASKRCNELMAYAYSHLYDFTAIGLRFFTVYGPWGRPDMSYYLFADALKNKQPITLFNKGQMSRDFTYVTDIADGIILALRSGCPTDVFNLGCGCSRPLMDLISHLEKRFGTKALFTHLETKGEAKMTFADLTKATAILGYRPKVTLEEGLDAFINWYHQYGDLDFPKEQKPAVTSR